MMSNLDDVSENGLVHHCLEQVKFGHGCASDHTCKDIQADFISRKQAIKIKNHYSQVKPRDLSKWLNYIGIEVQKFGRIADTYRYPRVWCLENGT